MSLEAIDEWDENFLDEAIRIELEAIASRNPIATTVATLNLQNNVSSNSTSSFLGLGLHAGGNCGGGVGGGAFSFSPPRELSQRFPDECETIEFAAPPPVRNGGFDNRSVSFPAGFRKDKEVERLKKELGRVSKQLSHMEHECLSLQKDRDKKDEQLKLALFQIEAKDAQIHNLREASKSNYSMPYPQLCNEVLCADQARHSFVSKEKNSDGISRSDERTKMASSISNILRESSGRFCVDHINLDGCHLQQNDIQTDNVIAAFELNRCITVDNGVSSGRGIAEKSSSPHKDALLKHTRTTGVQTDLQDPRYCDSENALFPGNNLKSKLLSIWNHPSDKNLGRHLVTKLLVTCSTDLVELFRCTSAPFRLDPEFHIDENIPMNPHLGVHLLQSTEVVKITNFSEILTMVHKDMAQVDTLVDIVLDLCCLENVSVAFRSLRILHSILQHLFNCTSGQRNVLVNQSRNNERYQVDRNINLAFPKLEKAVMGNEKLSPQLPWLRGSEQLSRENDGSFSNWTDLPKESLLSCVSVMQQISTKNALEHIRIEAISIMNLIMRVTPSAHRDKYDILSLLGTVSHLLQKEFGVHIQFQAVCLLFVLLNCQKTLVKFSCSWKQSSEHAEILDGSADPTAFQQAVSSILEGLAVCLLNRGTSAQELKLQKHIIIMLAFIASGRKSGFEILCSEIHQGLNFLELIIRVLASLIDAESADGGSEYVFEERASLMREALILLNRLASSPAFSKATLGVLTNANGTASSTIDVASSLSKKSRRLVKLDSRREQMEAEISDLARTFRLRVFSFLGESF